MDREPKLRLSSLQVEEMGRLVTDYFVKEGHSVRVSGFDIYYGDGSHGGLANLAQTLATIDQADWARAIAGHFTALSADEDRPVSWEEAAPMVRLRLYASAHLPPGDRSVVWPVNDDLVVALMIDGSDTAASVSESELTDWHVKPELSFDRALHNTVELEPYTDETTQLEDGTEIHFITGGFYTSARLLVLENHLGEAPHGAVIAVPNRHTLLYHPILDFTAVGAINRIVAEAARRYDEGPGSISPSLYWWNEGELTRLQATIQGERIRFSPPDDFVQMLNEVVESTKRKKRGLFRRT
jgi:hypothetical protein